MKILICLMLSLIITLSANAGRIEDRIATVCNEPLAAYDPIRVNKCIQEQNASLEYILEYYGEIIMSIKEREPQPDYENYVEEVIIKCFNFDSNTTNGLPDFIKIRNCIDVSLGDHALNE